MLPFIMREWMRRRHPDRFRSPPYSRSGCRSARYGRSRFSRLMIRAHDHGRPTQFVAHRFRPLVPILILADDYLELLGVANMKKAGRPRHLMQVGDKVIWRRHSGFNSQFRSPVPCRASHDRSQNRRPRVLRDNHGCDHAGPETSGRGSPPGPRPEYNAGRADEVRSI